MNNFRLFRVVNVFWREATGPCSIGSFFTCYLGEILCLCLSVLSSTPDFGVYYTKRGWFSEVKSHFERQLILQPWSFFIPRTPL